MENDLYYVAVVQRDFQFFEGPFEDADEAERVASLRRQMDHTNAVVMGVR